MKGLLDYQVFISIFIYLFLVTSTPHPLKKKMIKMKTFIFVVLIAGAVVAHPPTTQHPEHLDEKPITEASTEVKTDEKLPVKIYYEGLCPDSRKLLADLGREYFTFNKYINLSFVAFGRAKSLDAEGNEFECHHGPKECVSNRIHSCGVKYLKSQNAQQQFVVCQMRLEADQTGKEVRKTNIYGKRKIPSTILQILLSSF